MDCQPLGNTGLTSSVLGFGTGGPSRVGLCAGGSEADAERVIRTAFDHGVNFFDTAQAYGTEALVGNALRGIPRDEVILSTKLSHWEDLDEAGVMLAVDERLRLLQTDYLDICHVHAVTSERYTFVAEHIFPVLQRARDAGKIRFLGITEAFNPDPGHRMLQTAVADRLWDVIMVGFNILNQSARERVIAPAREAGVGVLAMFAVRLALSRPDRLREVIAELRESGRLELQEIEAAGGSADDPLGFVVRDSDAANLVEASYRFVRHEPGVHVTLSGTGSEAHLLQNIASVQLAPLDPSVVGRLRHLFRSVDSVSAQ